jgi:hypothetical protein
MFFSKASSTCVAAGGVAPKCFQGKYGKLSTLNVGYGKDVGVEGFLVNTHTHTHTHTHSLPAA